MTVGDDFRLVNIQLSHNVRPRGDPVLVLVQAETIYVRACNGTHRAISSNRCGDREASAGASD